MSNFLSPTTGDEEPFLIGEVLRVIDPDIALPVQCVVAHRDFRVEVSAEDYEYLPGIGLYVPAIDEEEDERAIFGFTSVVSDITSINGGILTEGSIELHLMSRYESPLSVVDYDEVLEQTIVNGGILVQHSIDISFAPEI